MADHRAARAAWDASAAVDRMRAGRSVHSNSGAARPGRAHANRFCARESVAAEHRSRRRCGPCAHARRPAAPRWRRAGVARRSPWPRVLLVAADCARSAGRMRSAGQTGGAGRHGAISGRAHLIAKLSPAALDAGDGALAGADNGHVALVGRGQCSQESARRRQKDRVRTRPTPRPARATEQIQRPELRRAAASDRDWRRHGTSRSASRAYLKRSIAASRSSTG